MCVLALVSLRADAQGMLRVMGNGINVPSHTFHTSTLSGTNFTMGTVVSHSFTLCNDGATNLTLNAKPCTFSGAGMCVFYVYFCVFVLFHVFS